MSPRPTRSPTECSAKRRSLRFSGVVDGAPLVSRLPRVAADLGRKGRRRRGDVLKRLDTDIPDRMLGACRDQDCTASLDLECFVIDDHEPAPADHDVDLLAVIVRMQALLATGFAKDPSHGQPCRAKLWCEEQARHLTAAFVARSIVAPPQVHRAGILRRSP